MRSSSSPGRSITAPLASGLGGGDWLRRLQVGTPDTTYLQYLFIGVGVTNRM